MGSVACGTVPPPGRSSHSLLLVVAFRHGRHLSRSVSLVSLLYLLVGSAVGEIGVDLRSGRGRVTFGCCPPLHRGVCRRIRRTSTVNPSFVEDLVSTNTVASGADIIEPLGTIYGLALDVSRPFAQSRSPWSASTGGVRSPVISLFYSNVVCSLHRPPKASCTGRTSRRRRSNARTWTERYGEIFCSARHDRF